MSEFRNLTEMFRAACERGGDRVAIRYHDGDSWCDVPWERYHSEVAIGVEALRQFDIQPGDRVALLAANSFDWLVADHAILAAGAVGVPMHSTLTRSQIRHQLKDSGAKLILAADTDPVPIDLCNIRRFPGEPLDCDSSWSWAMHLARGRLLELGTFEVNPPDIGPDDPATIIYTSGTTGHPKGVVLTHGNLLSNAAATLASSDFTSDEVVLGWLPLSHVYARTCDHYLTTLAGMTLCLARSPETVVEDLRAIQPTWMNGVPRFYEKVWNSVRMLDPEGRRDALYSIFGGNIRQLSSGGAPLSLDVCLGYHDAGIPLFEGYGLTESSPVIAFNGLRSYRLGTVGPPLPGVEVCIADDGEVQTRGPHVMPGYWNNPEATAEAIDPDGWLRTGDLGSLDDDGFLTITGRKKELLVLSSGKNVVPNQVEAILGTDPLVEQAVVLGDNRPYCVALVVPNPERLASEAAETGTEPTAADNVLVAPTLRDRLLTRLERLQSDLSPHERVRRIAFLARPLSIEDGDLTASFKLRREAIAATFADVIAALYEEPRTDSE